jgi:hypothetical protein
MATITLPVDCPFAGDYEFVLEPIRIIQEKLNGYFVEFTKSAGRITAALKGGRDIWGLLSPDITGPFSLLPDETILCCELHCQGEKSASVITLLNSGDPRLMLTPFAAFRYNGKAVDFQGFEAAMQRHGIRPARCIRYSPAPFVPDVMELLAQAQAAGIEGYVLKVDQLDRWYKLKPLKTVDAFVIDYTLSASKSFAGRLKSFVVGVHDGPGLRILADVSSGFEHEFKRSCDPQAWIGRVMEVSYRDILSRGRLQFPKFERWRDDKQESECSIKQVA